MASTQLHIRVLGGFAVSMRDQTVPEGAWHLRKAKSVVKLLALTPGHQLHRERVAELLWPDRDRSSAANNLHQALYAARRAFDAAGEDGAGRLRLSDDALSLSPDAPLRVDLAEFEKAATSARDRQDRHAYRAALDLYGGELLPEDRYEEWTMRRREAARELRLGLLVELAALCVADGEDAMAIDALQQAIVDDPLHEQAHRRLMRLFAAGGRRQQALGQFQELRQTLRRELEADPEPQTRELYQEILAGRFEQAADAGAAAEERVPAARRPAPAGHRQPHNLPLQLTSFIGRGRELGEVRGALERTRLLTLTGPGGCGKTRLALEVAEGEVRRFEDGVWLVELASVFDPDLVVHEIATALDLRVRSSEQAADVLAGQIGNRRLMLVVDNCEHLIAPCAELAERLLRACPGLRILATSREPLRVPGEVTWRVPSLALPDIASGPDLAALEGYEAVRLFGERASDVAAGFRLTDENAAAVVEICLRLDGMPLAIELAAARAALLSPTQIAERLRESLAVLGEGKAGPTRQQTLTATLEWSHDLLDPDERALFRRLGVFAGSFRLDAAEMRLLRRRDRVRRQSLRLARAARGQVAGGHRGGGRREPLPAAGDDPPVRPASASGKPPRASSRTRPQGNGASPSPRRRSGRPRSTPAPSTCGSSSNTTTCERRWPRRSTASPPVALQLAVALWEFWRARGHFAEGSRWLDDALARNPERSALRARALFAAGAFDVRRGRVDRVVRLGEESVEIYRELGDRGATAEALHTAAFIQHSGFMRWYHADRATGGGGAPFRPARIRGEPRDRRRGGRSHDRRSGPARAGNRGALSRRRRGRDRAMRESVELAESAGGENGTGVWVVTIGMPLDRDRRGRLRLYFEETLLLFRHVRPEVAAGYFLCNLSVVARARQDYALAGEVLDDALARLRDRGDRFAIAVALNLMGGLARSREQFELGREWLDEALEIRQDLGDRREIGVTLGNRGLLEGRAGEPERGRELMSGALRLMRQTEDVPGAAGVALNVANLELEAGEFERAMPLLQECADAYGANWYLRPVAWPLRGPRRGDRRGGSGRRIGGARPPSPDGGTQALHRCR